MSMTPLEATDIERLRELLAVEEPGDWIDHDGSGRPNQPRDYVEVFLRSGNVATCDSAFVRWPWVEAAELLGYDDDPDPQNDVLKWRHTKRPPSDRDLAAFVPSLLEAATRVKVLEEALRPFAQASVGLNPGAGDRCLVSLLPACQLTIGDLRRARTALTASEDDRGSKGEGRG